jgi:hypothetical protein
MDGPSDARTVPDDPLASQAILNCTLASSTDVSQSEIELNSIFILFIHNNNLKRNKLRKRLLEVATGALISPTQTGEGRPVDSFDLYVHSKIN